MKLFQQLLVAPAAFGLLAPLSASASEVNLDAISNYSESNLEINANSFKQKSSNNILLSGGEGLVESSDFTGGFSETTTASFGVDFLVGAEIQKKFYKKMFPLNQLKTQVRHISP